MTATKPPTRRVGDAVVSILQDRLSDMNATLVDSNSKLIDIATDGKLAAEKIIGLQEKIMSLEVKIDSALAEIVALRIKDGKHEGQMTMVKWIGSTLGVTAGVISAVAMVVAVFKP